MMFRWRKKNSPRNRQKSKPFNTLKKIFVSLLILVVVLGTNKLDFALMKRINDGIKHVLTREYDFSTVIKQVNLAGFIKENVDSEFLKKVFESQEEIQTLSPSKELFLNPNEPLIIMPVKGEITSEFGLRLHPIYKELRQHNGIDINASEGEAVKVVMDGVVLKVWEDKEFGKTVKVEHSNNTITLYAHCSEILVDEGDRVKKGDVIAKVGATGSAVNPHLHFELWVDGEPIDPLKKIMNNIQ